MGSVQGGTWDRDDDMTLFGDGLLFTTLQGMKSDRENISDIDEYMSQDEVEGSDEDT